MGPIDVKMHLASFLSPRPPYTLLSLTSSHPTYPSYPLTCSPLSVYPPYHTHLHQLKPFFLPAKHHSIPLAPFHHAFLTLYFLHKFSSSPGKLPKDANISTLILSLLSLFPVPCSSLSPLSVSLSSSLNSQSVLVFLFQKFSPLSLTLMWCGWCRILKS